jgi:hypothetical protein
MAIGEWVYIGEDTEGVCAQPEVEPEIELPGTTTATTLNPVLLLVGGLVVGGTVIYILLKK